MFGLEWFLLGLVGLVVVAQVFGWYRYVPVAARVFSNPPWLPVWPREPLEETESVEFTTEDGCRLEGTYLPSLSGQCRGVVAFCHELNGDRWSAIPYMNHLRRHGFDVFTFDFRSHGQSDSTPGCRALPWVTTYDLRDIRAAITYLCSRDDADGRGIALMGISRGATIALCAAAEDPRVRTLVIDGVCPTEKMQLHYLHRFLEIYFRPMWLGRWVPEISFRSTLALARMAVGRRERCRFVRVDSAARKLQQPVLMVHGEADTHIPLDVVRSLRGCMSTRTKLWVVPEAKHNGAITVAQQEYHRRIVRFFDRHLASSPVSAPIPRPVVREQHASAPIAALDG